MDENDVRIGAGYPTSELARAFVTALSHEDAATRRLAEERIDRWRGVLRGMAQGRLRIGSRKPVAGLPEWVTLEVLHGGFAAGTALAGGELRPYELALAERHDLPADRGAIFGFFLTEAGQRELLSILDSGTYRIDLPEEATLLAMAWLLRAGDRLGALVLLDTIEPYAAKLRFTPRPASTPAADPSLLARENVGWVRGALSTRQPNERLETMREALAVWNPFADEVLQHWLDRDDEPAWIERGRALLDRYRELAAAHTRCTKHRKPKENLAILLSALEITVSGQELSPRTRGLLHHATDSMVRRRGRPGSPGHRALRNQQTAVAAVPSYYDLTQAVLWRLADLDDEAVLPDLTPYVAPEDGVDIPAPVQATVQLALAAPIEKLVALGILPSAEMLARLVPRISSLTAGQAYPDEPLRRLMTAHYQAFRRRRSVLLLNLEHQVRITELPWVQAVAAHRQSGDGAQARATLVRLGELMLTGFPGTIVPNPMLRELDALSQAAGLDLPFVEELAADIFMGRFSPKFQRAAQLAGDFLQGSLYERYYGIDYAGLPERDFAALCVERARHPRGSVAANGMVIEQAQILTTHNLATLAGLDLDVDWLGLADRAFDDVLVLLSQLRGNPRPLRTIKDAAYGWRQMIFFLSMTSADEQQVFAAEATGRLLSVPDFLALTLDPVVSGLRHVVSGGTFHARGVADGYQRFLGWAADGHWLRTAASYWH